ncbi:MAG: CBS domain-containing protein [Candidatus Omnitrophica bacterium]|nr:CBS domain-containing protein [Candidatus Omnitrophota bacterium]
MLNALIENIMSDEVIKVKEAANIAGVAHLLLRHRINGILVVKNDAPNTLVGIVTITDLLKLLDGALKKGTKHRLDALKKINQIKVGEIATKKVISVQKTDSVLKVAALMHRKNIHTIPVYDKDKLVGILGKHDILNIAFC